MSALPVGVGILGTGFARSTQIPCFEVTPGIDVVSVYSRDQGRADALAKEFGVPHATNDLDALLARPEVDLVVVSTPPHLHLPHTLAALRAGKHVLCEKPTALHGGEAAEMLAAARAAGKLHLMDHELRFHPRRRAFQDLVKGGFVGALYSVEYRSAGSFRIDPSRPWSWWSDATQGGGVLGALGSHCVDAIRSWFGEITEARGNLRTMITSRPDPAGGTARPVTADDYAVAWFRLAGGGEGTLSLSAVAREEPWTRVVAHGEQGSLRLDEENRVWKRAHGEGAWSEVAADDAPTVPVGSRVPDTVWARAFLLYAAAIRDTLAAGKTELPGASTFEDGLKNQLVLDAVRESARRSDWVAVDAAATRA